MVLSNDKPEVELVLLALLMAIAGVPDRPKFTDNRVPTAELVGDVESKIVMPPGAEPLASYDRAYTQAKLDGKDYVLGQMLDHRLMEDIARHGEHPLPPRIRRVLISEITPAFDGGCAILTLIYEIGKAEPPKIVCNPPGPGE